jgi:hypothetical protein
MRSTALLLVALATLGACLLPTSGEGAGPWRGQVVDAETGQPLEGVVVLAIFVKRSPGLVHPRTDFHDVDELVTDAQGRFVIPGRSLKTANPFVSIEGPTLIMFKPSYGHYRFRGEREWQSLDAYHREQRYAEAQKRFAGAGAVFELPPLKTSEERRDALPSVPFEVPPARVPRLVEAIKQERAFLGLQP